MRQDNFAGIVVREVLGSGLVAFVYYSTTMTTPTYGTVRVTCPGAVPSGAVAFTRPTRKDGE